MSARAVAVGQCMRSAGSSKLVQVELAAMLVAVDMLRRQSESSIGCSMSPFADCPISVVAEMLAMELESNTGYSISSFAAESNELAAAHVPARSVE